MMQRVVRVVVGALLLAAVGLLLGGCTLNTSDSPTSTDIVPRTSDSASGDAPLIVAWVERGDLTIWRSVDAFPRRTATGGVIRPVIAPDGAYVAYVRGPGGDPRTLWVSDTPGANERQLVNVTAIEPADATRRIQQVVWSPDARALYLTTRTGRGDAAQPAADLWRVDVASGAVERLLDAGAGGAIAPSPDGARIALVQPGESGGALGQIALYDVETASRHVLLEFAPVTTASGDAWTPDVRWLPDGSALRTAIPDPAVAQGTGSTALWALPVAGSAQQLGLVDAAAGALPVYSADGAWIAFRARPATPDQRDWTLIVARGDGSAATAYADGSGTFGGVTWAPSGARFTYRDAETGALWIGGPGGTPLRFPGEDVAVQALQWADADTVVFLTPADDGTDGMTLQFDLLDVPRPADAITTFDDPPTTIDARLPS